MTTLQQLQSDYGMIDCRDLGSRKLEQLRDGLKKVVSAEIASAENGKEYIELLKKFREAVAENDKLHGDNYPQLLNSLLSVGEDGLYSNSLRFIFELIQNVDDCDYNDSVDCKLDMRFDFEKDEIILTYNEVGFSPFNVFAITGIAEAAKNVSSEKNQIGEKGIGFKSVFGVANRVRIRSGWFSFELFKENFTIPVPIYNSYEYCNGTQMTLYVPGRAKQIYKEIKGQYCKRDALFSRNPLLFLNKLTSLKFYYDVFRSMEFHVSRTESDNSEQFKVEKGIEISVDLRDYDQGSEVNVKEEIHCTRYTSYIRFSKEACRARYGDKTKVGQENGKAMILCAVIPDADFISEVGNGALYSFLPTQLKLTVPIVCHVPFKLDASREFVDPQENNLWFQEASRYLSDLMDKVFLDYSHTVKENIVRYLPDKGKSLFAVNNGKEECLTEQKSFNGAHYLELPIFFTVDNDFKKADEIFCFNKDEDIKEPEKVYHLMGYQRSLFISPVSVNKFGIRIERNVRDELFKRAFQFADKTSDILDYLDSVNYEYPEQLIRKLDPIKISQAQLLIIVKHRKLSKVLRIIICEEIKNNKRFGLEINDADVHDISEFLDDEFEMSDIPKVVRKYMEYCHQKCVCIDEPDDIYLPCYNAILISSINPLPSFLSFCRDIDPNDPFTTRITWREKTNELNKYVEDSTISEEEYMRVLRQIRISIRDSLGKEGYKSYLEIILKSGTDRGRFIQELLQNADDCYYGNEVVPTFSLSLEDKTIITEYNETGFTRANIRSITAIGESTKNKLLSHHNQSIGEKGVGFKTIFAIASKVTIHSGNYHFSLSDKEPTIPRVSNDAEEAVAGTRMEIELKGNEITPTYKEKELLELCLSLRNLKKLTIGKIVVTINDTEDKRTITIGNREYSFKRFYHAFTITDEGALEERKNGSRDISEEQQIVCYVPEFSPEKNYDFPLYCGLPTKHKIRVPIAIDAPFSLTTSREEIETEGSKWNDIIRNELYVALINVIDFLKTEERSKVFRFLRFVPRFQGTVRVYSNETFDNKYLNGYDLVSQLRTKEILPTYNSEIFAIPIKHKAYRFPEPAVYIFNKLMNSNYEGIDTSSVIDVSSGDYDSVLNAFACETADCSIVLPIIYRYSEQFIKDESFRNALYEYLGEVPDEYTGKIKTLKIIPVYSSENDSTMYISWRDDSIFVKPNSTRSGDNYYVLNEKVLTKSICEHIYKANINEMDIKWERNRYNNQLEEMLGNQTDISSIYNFLIKEYRSGKLLKNDSFKILSAYRIPLKNQCGEITRENLFVCDKSGYFNTDMVKSITVHDECRGLAKDIETKSLSDIHYEDFYYDDELTADEVEELLDEPNHYFVYYEELLRGFYRDGLLSDELLQEYGLDYLSIGSTNEYDYDSDYEFPSEAVGNMKHMTDHIRKLWNDPIKIISVKVERTVRKGQNKNGSTFDLNINDSREGALKIYSPEERHDLCFCQMCLKVKPKPLIEVNNIELLPDYYFPQLRIALCLECSKRFEALRQNNSIRNAFIQSIIDCDVYNEGNVEIPIGSEGVITFTAKHLAEIQEILKQKPNIKG
ncbi:sacsin N-terminal ATP-binding-like domain-containing protein [Ruminococcus albus]|uniref:sacsin N-terminal ATP-binding-like domain-containing protein n=1 Tax=Ruminococcus albus TaxID=1264 RepID=UPI000466303D|nr:hypothetical protein [Ruminococcus albus]